MKKTLVYLFCVCFPLLATNNTKQPLFIGHETCNINIYAGLSALADSLNNHVDYNIKTVTDIETLLHSKGYTVIASLPLNTMMFDIKSNFTEKQMQELDDDNIILNYNCWNITAIISTKGEKTVYEKPYSICRESNYLVMANPTYNYGTNILRQAIYNYSYSVDEKQGENNSYIFKNPLADSMHAILFGANSSVLKQYKEIPDDLGILKSVPYCCTPQDMTPWCVKFRSK
ncbi:MAG: hypothetical protein WCQ47_00520 [bacterium]